MTILRGMSKPTFRKLGLVVLFISMTMIFARCSQKNNAGSNGNNSTGINYTAGTFSYVYNKSLKTACIECHVPDADQKGAKLDFTSQDTAYQSLLGNTVLGINSVGQCGALRIVEPGRPSSSYLLGMNVPSYRVDNFGDVTGCTPLNTHLTPPYLSDEEQNSIVSWIQSGAQNN